MRYTTLVQPSIKVEAVARTTLPVSNTQQLLRSRAVAGKNRFLSVACYFGLAPFLWSSGVVRQQNRLVNHHMQYSLAFSFVTLCALVFNFVIDRIQFWLTVDVWKPTYIDFSSTAIPMYMICDTMTFACAALLSLFSISWIVSMVGAWQGRTPQIPVISFIASKFQALRIAVYWSLLIDILLVLFIGLMIRSMQIAKSLPARGDVYVLYPQSGYIPITGLYETYMPPRWAVTLAFYPLVRAAMEKYGDQAVTLLPLSEESFNEAVQNGRFIFVASHGGVSPGSFAISTQPYQEFKPTDVVSTHVGEQLQYVYFAGCWTGHLEADWRRVLGLDDGTMYDRLTYVDEHMAWVWFKSSSVIAALH